MPRKRAPSRRKSKAASRFTAPDSWVKSYQKLRRKEGKRYSKADVLKNSTFRKWVKQARASRSTAPGTKGFQARERLGLIQPLKVKPLKGGEIDPDIPPHFVDAYRKLVRRQTGKRLSDASARKDGRLQALWRDFKRAKGKSARGKRARILVELGLRDDGWSMPLGESPKT